MGVLAGSLAGSQRARRVTPVAAEGGAVARPRARSRAARHRGARCVRSSAAAAPGEGGGGAEDSAGSGGKGSGEQQQRRKKKNAFTHFEVETAVPPTKRLGLHPFLRNTQCGDNITVDERDYIVNKVSRRRTGRCERPSGRPPRFLRTPRFLTLPPAPQVTYVYKLTRGRYVKDNRKLSVTPVGRHVTNMFLSSLYEDS